MKRLEIPFYNFPSASHLKIILLHLRGLPNISGINRNFFVLEAMSEMSGIQKNTTQYITIQ